MAMLVRELDRIAEQVPEHLLQPRRIRCDGAGKRVDIELQSYPLGIGGRLHRLPCLLKHGGDGHGLWLETKLPCRDARHIQEIVDELILSDGVSLDDLDGPLALV